MKIEVHTLVWRQPMVLRMFLNHYCSFADRVVVWDYGCLEDPAVLAARHSNVEVRQFRSPDGLCAEDYTTFRNICWRDSAADWFIVVDADEWIYHADIRNYLHHVNADVLYSVGFHLLGGQIADISVGVNSWRGAYDPYYSKPSVFRGGLDRLRIARGGHAAATSGVVLQDSELLLLHGKWLGTPNAVRAHQNEIRKNISPREVNPRQVPYVELLAEQVVKLTSQLLTKAIPVAEMPAAVAQGRFRPGVHETYPFAPTHWGVQGFRGLFYEIGRLFGQQALIEERKPGAVSEKRKPLISRMNRAVADLWLLHWRDYVITEMGRAIDDFPHLCELPDDKYTEKLWHLFDDFP